jgi:hypothetical protein
VVSTVKVTLKPSGCEIAVAVARDVARDVEVYVRRISGNFQDCMNGMTTSIDTCVQNGPNMGISNDQPPSLNEYTAGFQRLNALSWHSPFSPDILSTVWCFYSSSTGMAAVIFYSFFLIKAHVFRAYAVYPYAAQPFLVKSYAIYLYLVKPIPR